MALCVRVVSVAATLTFVVASPFWDNFIQSDDNLEDDEGLTAQLMEIGESLFGSPKKESG